MGFVGALLGWKGVLAAFLVGTVVGAGAGIFDKLRSGVWPPADSEEARRGFLARFGYRWSSGNSVMPYGPFLAFGCLVLLYAPEPVLGFFARLVSPPGGGG